MKLREREGQGVDLGRYSKVIYGWWMVDILSLELTLNLVATHPPTTGSLNKWLDEPVRGQVRLVKVRGGV